MKTFQKYPCVRYHQTLAPEGRTIRNTAEEADLGSGWVDTPAAFHPGYQAPTSDPPDGTPMDTVVAPAKPPERYPAVRYARDGRTQVVGSAEAEAALDPAEWKDTSDLKAWGDAPAPPPPAPATSAPTPVSGDDPLHAMTVPEAVDAIGTITDISALDALAGREAKNPSGARKGVVKAITARMTELMTTSTAR